IDEGIPTAQLSASPGRDPTLLAEVMDHLEHVEVARNGEVQHAEEEACDGERKVRVDRKLLRDGGDQHFGQLPRATYRAEPDHSDEESDTKEGAAHVVGSDVFHRVDALQKVEQ